MLNQAILSLATVLFGALFAGTAARNVTIATGSKAWGKAVISGYFAIMFLAAAILFLSVR